MKSRSHLALNKSCYAYLQLDKVSRLLLIGFLSAPANTKHQLMRLMLAFAQTGFKIIQRFKNQLVEEVLCFSAIKSPFIRFYGFPSAFRKCYL